MSQLIAVLWYVDSHHEHLASRGIHLPEEVSTLQGFNNWHRKHCMTSSGLSGHVQSLSRTLAQPWPRRCEYAKLKSLTEGIVLAMYKYKEY